MIKITFIQYNNLLDTNTFELSGWALEKSSLNLPPLKSFYDKVDYASKTNQISLPFYKNRKKKQLLTS